jgi:hypothetical protein
VSQYLVFEHNTQEMQRFESQMAKLDVLFDFVAPSLPSDGSLKGANIPELNKLHLDTIALTELRRKGRMLKPCTWLYYTSTINPGGSISPCCMVTNQSADFGSLQYESSSKTVFDQFKAQWNGPVYRTARRLFNAHSVASWAGENLHPRPADGMGLGQSGRGKGLICAECPIPEDIHVWSGFIARMQRELLSAIGWHLRRLEIRAALNCGARALLLMVARFFQ